MARLAVDIGGTFTDLALERSGRLWTIKVLTTPAAPEEGVLEGISRILSESHVARDEVTLVMHATTLATNALIERKGATTALVTTEGFRDVLQLGNESRYDQYDLNIELPEPLVPRHLRLPVPERLDRSGRVLLPLDEAAVRNLVPLLLREQVQSVAIGFLHSYVWPGHEQRARDILHAALPDVPISISSEVSPEMREWERFSTTAANAYVQPLIGRYLRRLQDRLLELGMSCPLLLMLSGGGLTTVETAVRFPVRLVESGPAAGAVFAAGVARRFGEDHVIAFDMGGTTAKLCLIDHALPQTSRQFEVARIGRFQKGSGLPLRIPVVEMVEIGAGGGSIAGLDLLGRVTVGPSSAGSVPGPACFGRGGTRATVTDANLLVGHYDPATFAGGRLPLDPARAVAAMERDLPGTTNATVAALGVLAVVDENMASAARQHAIESGTQTEGRTMVAFGGGGPVHAARIAEKIGVNRVIVPRGAGVGSAIGLLEAPAAYEVVRSLFAPLKHLDRVKLNLLLESMQREAVEIVRLAAGDVPMRSDRFAFMRYIGQGHEIVVPLAEGHLDDKALADLRKAYEAVYAAAYERTVPGTEIEVLGFQVAVATTADRASVEAGAWADCSDAGVGQRDVFDPRRGRISAWSIVPRSNLTASAAPVAAPAILTEDETSTLVPFGWTARVDLDGSVILERNAASGG